MAGYRRAFSGRAEGHAQRLHSASVARRHGRDKAGAKVSLTWARHLEGKGREQRNERAGSRYDALHFRKGEDHPIQSLLHLLLAEAVGGGDASLRKGSGAQRLLRLPKLRVFCNQRPEAPFDKNSSRQVWLGVRLRH